MESICNFPFLHFNGEGDALVFLWVPEYAKKEYFKILTDASIRNFSIKDILGRTLYENIKSREEFRFDRPGIYELFISPLGFEFDFQLEVSNRVYPFIIPGPGLTPSHFPIPHPTLLFSARNTNLSLWTYIPEGMEKVKVGAWLPEGYVNVISSDEVYIPLIWRPKKSLYRVTELEVTKPGWYKFALKPPEKDFRFTIYEGFPLFFDRPPLPFPYYQLSCKIYNEQGERIDSRIEVFKEKQRIGLLDIPKESNRKIYTLPGLITIQASCGIEFAMENKTFIGIEGEASELEFKLSRILKREDGWVCGDHHVHSYFEDSSSTLEDVVISAKTSGLDYLFVSDEPYPILKAGLQRLNKSNEFLALPAQEITDTEFHMNALNIYENLSFTDNNTNIKIKQIIDNIRVMASKHPNALMLNHPSHVSPEALKQAYFRSWWIIDQFSDIYLVENFDFENWFKRLNEGRKIIGLWTTDTHDVTLIPPGYKRTYIFVGGEMNESTIIMSLINGHCFNTRYPGALLYLTINDVIPGETACPDDKGYIEVKIKCESNRPIELIEIIGNGEILLNIYGQGSNSLEAKILLYVKDEVNWIIARVKAKEEDLPKDRHRWEPLMTSRYIAFTNPIWIERRN